MKLSMRSRYGMRLMIDLAQHWGEGHIALKDIAERQGISRKYLEQIVSLLTSHKLLKATRGFSGGYQLARDPHEITAADVVQATENSLSSLACIADPVTCERSSTCPALGLWAGLDDCMRKYLEGITLSDLAKPAPAPVQ